MVLTLIMDGSGKDSWYRNDIFQSMGGFIDGCTPDMSDRNSDIMADVPSRCATTPSKAFLAHSAAEGEKGLEGSKLLTRANLAKQPSV